MKRFFCGLMCAFLVSSFTFASESAKSRAEAAATVLNEIMAAPDNGIPVEILNSAKCVAVVPNLVKGGFVVGGSHGRGMATCKLSNGSWTPPAPLTMTGGSIGFQIGLQGVDLIMMIMNDRGMQALLTNKFKIGADASAAAGPVGRHVEGSTDWKLKAEILTYSRARGLFAGITVNGSTIGQDEAATRELYGKFVPFKTILTGRRRYASRWWRTVCCRCTQGRGHGERFFERRINVQCASKPSTTHTDATASSCGDSDACSGHGHDSGPGGDSTPPGIY